MVRSVSPNVLFLAINRTVLPSDMDESGPCDAITIVLFVVNVTPSAEWLVECPGDERLTTILSDTFFRGHSNIRAFVVFFESECAVVT
jgi:hypothetical protein